MNLSDEHYMDSNGAIVCSAIRFAILLNCVQNHTNSTNFSIQCLLYLIRRIINNGLVGINRPRLMCSIRSHVVNREMPHTYSTRTHEICE